MKNSPAHRFFLYSLGLAILVLRAQAGSATWNPNPIDNNWNNAANWTPATVPNGPNDIATFASSDTTTISITATTKVRSVVFENGASAFTITANPPNAVTFVDGGITNSSGSRRILSPQPTPTPAASSSLVLPSLEIILSSQITARQLPTSPVGRPALRTPRAPALP